MIDEVVIRLHVTHAEGSFYFEKPAPKLPPFVTWHEGLMIELVKNKEWLIVDHVIVNLDGTLIVVVEFDMPGCGWGAMAKAAWWEKRGWISRKKL